jgi:transcription elongation factor SPT6
LLLRQNEAEKTKKKDSFEQHLKTTRSLMAVCAEQLTQTAASLKIAEEKSVISNPGQRNAVDTSNKVCKDKLWNAEDYKRYVTNLKDHRQVMDVYKYLSLIKEGTDAVRTKNALTVGENDKKKRSRRFDRDYYRTCVSQGLRAISYQFALSPFRAGIKLEDNMTLAGGFNWDKNIAGESTDDMYDVGPRKWDAPTVHDSDPSTFASDLVSSGELVLMASMNKGGPDDSEVSDPLRGCRYVAAMELSHEPRIRKQLREIYRANAVLSTRPTSKGLENIDPFHELYGLHLLRNKSVKDHFPVDNQALQRKMAGLDTDERTELDAKIKSIERDSCIQYMNILKAERSGHVKYHVHLPFVDGGLDDDSWYKQGDDYFNSREKQDFALLMNELEKIYLPTEPDTEEWNEERNKIIRFALINFLLPQFEAELKRDLRTAAVKVGINAAGKNLKAMALEGPYRPSHLLGENRFLVPTGDLPIVGVCCSSDGREASYLAAVSERGELVDNLAIPSGTQVDGDKMRDKVITFLMQSRPSAIVVGSLAGLPCRLVARKLGALATQATEKWNNRGIQAQDEDDDEYDARMEEFRRMYPDDVEDDEVREEWKCNVEMVDDNVAQLFGRSVRGKKEFPDSPINLKCAISIARHAKDPLAELTYTWGVASDAGVFGTEMLYLNIHPLQQYLPKSMLLREHGLLTFVAGLGPRKAASLKHSMDRLGGVIASRKDVLVKRMAGPIVYNNAIAFLRIRDIDALSNQFLHPLDDTRLHPDVYIRNSWATKIAIDALEMDNGDNISNADRDDRAIKGIRDIMQNSRKEIKRLYNATKEEWERSYGHSFNVGGWDPKINVPSDSWRDKVDELDLETFADIIESSNQGKWLSHLTTIKWEFRLPFEDPRKPMDPLDREKLFRLLTGETDQTLCPGKEVTGKVARISDFGAHLKLEGDVPAFIPLRNLADGHVESAEDVVQIGTIVTAIVTEVKKDHMSVDLSLKMEDFRKDPNTWERPPSLPPLDQAFDSVAAANIEKGKSKVREERLAVARIAATGEVGMTGATTSIGRSKRVTRRACAHPAFRNSTSNEISKELKDGGELMVGEALIRPSSKNAESLAVHWLVRPGVIKVVEVLEEDKDNDASIGNTLKIKDEAYGSIDELLARFIAPMNERVEELTTYRKFLHFSEADVDEKLRDMKKENAEGVFYFLCWNEKFPGYASLRFIFNTPRDHAIGITPDGFSWSKKMYPNLDALINAFKTNPRGAVSVASSRQSANSSLRSVDTSKSSRWGGRSTESSVPRPPPGAPTWNTAPRPLPPASLPPPPQQGYRPAPPSLPPPPQHSYPPAPPGGYQRQ